MEDTQTCWFLLLMRVNQSELLVARCLARAIRPVRRTSRQPCGPFWIKGVDNDQLRVSLSRVASGIGNPNVEEDVRVSTRGHSQKQVHVWLVAHHQQDFGRGIPRSTLGSCRHPKGHSEIPVWSVGFSSSHRSPIC